MDVGATSQGMPLAFKKHESRFYVPVVDITARISCHLNFLELSHEIKRKVTN